MKKIKVKKQLRLDELLKYVWDNGITRTKFEGKDCSIYVDDNGNFNVLNEHTLWKSDLYTFTEEVEITEDTRLEEIFFIRTSEFKDGSTHKYGRLDTYISINALKKCNSYQDKVTLHEVWTVEGNGLGQLIWKDGEFVD